MKIKTIAYQRIFDEIVFLATLLMDKDDMAIFTRDECLERAFESCWCIDDILSKKQTG